MITKVLKFVIAFAVLFIIAFITPVYILAQTNLSQEFQDNDNTGGASTALEPIRIDENENKSSDITDEELREENNLTEKAEIKEGSAVVIDDNMQKSLQRFKFLSIASFVLAVIALVCCGYGFLRPKN